MTVANKVETMTFEKKRVDSITVTSDNIKNPEILAAVLEQECQVITKTSDNRPWVYLKDPGTLKTLGGVRLNKNSIGSFYLDTYLGHRLEEEMFGVVSKDNKNHVTNKIAVNDLSSLKKMIALINKLRSEELLYSGKRN